MNDDREAAALDFDISCAVPFPTEEEARAFAATVKGRAEVIQCRKSWCVFRGFLERPVTSRGGHGIKMAWITQERLDSLYREIERLRNERDGALEGIKSGLVALSVANERANSCAQGLAMWEARANDLAKENEELKRQISMSGLGPNY